MPRPAAPWPLLAPILVGAALVGAGCFNPTFDNPRCGPAGECPPGSDCVGGTCRAPSVDAAVSDAWPTDAPGAPCTLDEEYSGVLDGTGTPLQGVRTETGGFGVAVFGLLPPTPDGAENYLGMILLEGAGHFVGGLTTGSFVLDQPEDCGACMLGLGNVRDGSIESAEQYPATAGWVDVTTLSPPPAPFGFSRVEATYRDVILTHEGPSRTCTTYVPELVFLLDIEWPP
jgi:hypothetical protein